MAAKNWAEAQSLLTPSESNRVTAFEMREAIGYLERSYWASRPAYWINWTDGNDDNDGLTEASPIKTQEAWRRRVGDEPRVAGGMDVTIVGDSPEEMIWDAITTRGVQTYDPFTTTGKVLRVTGKLSASLGTFTITAVTAWNVPSGIRGLITIDALPVSFTASGLVGKLLRYANGTTFFVEEDVGSKTARVSTPLTAPDAYSNWNRGTLVTGNVTAHTIPVLSSPSYISSPAGVLSGMFFESLQFGTDTTTVHSSKSTSGTPWFLRCKLYGFDAEGTSNPQIYGSSVSRLHVYDRAKPHAESSYFKTDTVIRQGTLELAGHNAVLNGLRMDNHQSTMEISGSAAFFDAVTGISVGPGGRIDTSPSSGRIVGSVTTTGVSLGKDASLTTADARPPTLTAATEVSVGGTGRTWAAGPHINATNNARWS